MRCSQADTVKWFFGSKTESHIKINEIRKKLKFEVRYQTVFNGWMFWCSQTTETTRRRQLRVYFATHKPHHQLHHMIYEIITVTEAEFSAADDNNLLSAKPPIDWDSWDRCFTHNISGKHCVYFLRMGRIPYENMRFSGISQTRICISTVWKDITYT